MLKTEHIQKIVAPYIIGNEAIKKLIFLQLFTMPNQGEKINVLLIGDTASGKSDLAQETTKLCYNSAFMSRGASEAGLIGIATRYGLQGGILKEVDNGLLVIDELDKTDSNLRKSIIQLMDCYELRVAKFGWTQTIQANCNLICTANPRGNNWLSTRPTIDEVPFNPVLLNRFHIVAPFKSLKPEEYDKLVKSFMQRNDKKKLDEFRSKVADFVAEARDKYPEIKVPEPVLREAVNYVKKLKANYSNKIQHISPRQIHGMLALLQASARMSFRDTVNMDDYKHISQLYTEIINLWL